MLTKILIIGGIIFCLLIVLGVYPLLRAASIADESHSFDDFWNGKI